LLLNTDHLDLTADADAGGWARAFRVTRGNNTNGQDGGAFGAVGAGATPSYVFMAIPTADDTGYDSTKIMVLNNSGNVGIGNTTPSRMLHVGSASVVTGTPVANFQNADGTCTITPASSGSGIACSSDERLKENFQNVSGNLALESILKLQAVTYNFKTASTENRRTGYKAQNVQEVAPEFVSKDDRGFLQVYYDAFIPWITEAIKTLYNDLREMKADKAEIDARIKSLEADNAELKARLEKIEKALKSK